MQDKLSSFTEKIASILVIFLDKDEDLWYNSFVRGNTLFWRYDMAIINKDQILKVLNAYNPWWKTGTALNLTGGKIASNTSGGGGGIRLVSSKLTMSGKAEICYNHSLTKNNEKYNGGGIGAVYQAD